MTNLDFLAVTIEIDETGELRNVSSVADAAEILRQNWPVDRGRELSRARRACLDAMEGTGSVEEARTAFVAAAKEAGILIWNSAWRF